MGPQSFFFKFCFRSSACVLFFLLFLPHFLCLKFPPLTRLGPVFNCSTQMRMVPSVLLCPPSPALLCSFFFHVATVTQRVLPFPPFMFVQSAGCSCWIAFYVSVFSFAFPFYFKRVSCPVPWSLVHVFFFSVLSVHPNMPTHDNLRFSVSFFFSP